MWLACSENQFRCPVKCVCIPCEVCTGATLAASPHILWSIRSPHMMMMNSAIAPQTSTIVVANGFDSSGGSRLSVLDPSAFALLAGTVGFKSTVVVPVAVVVVPVVAVVVGVDVTVVIPHA